MLFSDKQVAKFINENFEPCWESVRPVPIITMDFGDGRVIKRSMHGNTITFVCLSDGTTVDALPGIYGPRTYEKCLSRLVEATKSISRSPEPQRMLTAYHKGLGAVSTAPILHIAEPEMQVLAGPEFFRDILTDNARNEQVRRPMIHEMLSQGKPVKPADINKRIYKKTLALDLDDPYLGLSAALPRAFPGEQ